MSTSVEEVAEAAKALPPDQRERFRELVGSLAAMFGLAMMMDIMAKTLALTPDAMGRLRDELNNMTWEMSDPDVRRRLANDIRGKYAHLPTGSEAFAARKAEEIALEERGSRP